MCSHLGFRVTVNAAGIFLFHRSRVSKHRHAQSEEVYTFYIPLYCNCILSLLLISIYIFSFTHTVVWGRHSGELRLQTLSDWGQGLLWPPVDPEAEIKQRCLNTRTQTFNKPTNIEHGASGLSADICVYVQITQKQNRKAHFLWWMFKRTELKMINQF